MLQEILPLKMPEVDTNNWKIEGYMTTVLKSGRMNWIENPVLTEHGILNDRLYALFNRDTKKMITGRDLKDKGNNLVRIISSIDAAANLTLSINGSSITVSPADTIGIGRFEMWGEEFEGQCYSEEVGKWVEAHTGISNSVLVNTSLTRLVPNEFIDESITISGQDAYPYHIVNLTTLEYLNERLIHQGLQPLDVLQTRANIIIRTPKPFEELFTRVFDVPGGRIEMPKPCVRCTFTGVDPLNGDYSSSKHLKVISSLYKDDPALTAYTKYWENLGVRGPIFGQNGIFKAHAFE